MEKHRKKKTKKKNQDEEENDYIVQEGNSEKSNSLTEIDMGKDIKADTDVNKTRVSQKRAKKRKLEDDINAQKSENRTRQKETKDAYAKHVTHFQSSTSKPGVLNIEKINKGKREHRLKSNRDDVVKKQKLGTECKLMEKLEELTGKSLRANKDKELSVQSQAIYSKKKKNVFRMEETPGEDSDLDAGLDPEKAAVRKKKREKRREKRLEKQKRKQLGREKAGTAKVLAIDYLKQWNTDRESWKFQKVRQVFLLQNMFNTSLVSWNWAICIKRYASIAAQWYTYASKSCRLNGKQCRPRWRGSLNWAQTCLSKT